MKKNRRKHLHRKGLNNLNQHSVNKAFGTHLLTETEVSIIHSKLSQLYRSQKDWDEITDLLHGKDLIVLSDNGPDSFCNLKL